MGEERPQLSDPLAHFRWLYEADYTDPSAIAERWDPELVINQDPAIPGERRQYKGYEGLATLVGELSDYSEQRWVPQVVEELPDGRWLVLFDVRGTGRVSGVPMEVGIGHVTRLRDGRVFEVDSYLGWDAARAAAARAGG